MGLGLGLAMAVLVIAGGLFVGPAPANAGTVVAKSAADARASWSCWADRLDDGTLQAGCATSGDGFGAQFFPYGEHLWVGDCFPNDHHTYAYLDVLDTPNVDYTRHHGRCADRDFNLSITDGTRVSLKVCSSQTSGAKCSPTVYGRA